MLDLAKAASVRGLAVFLAAMLLAGVLKAGDNSSDITGQLRLDSSFTRCDFFGFRFVKSVALLDIAALKRVTLMGINPR